MKRNKEFYRCACLVIEQILFVPEAIYYCFSKEKEAIY
jgi:hypothetical protein